MNVQEPIDDDAEVDDEVIPVLDEESGRGDHIPVSMIDLETIPRPLWKQVLVPIHPRQRSYVVSKIGDERLRELASAFVFELCMAENAERRARAEARAQARLTGVPLPAPDAEHGVTRPTVQVNFRLRRDDHAQLTQAAAAMGLRPTTLARALVLNGAAAILRERGA